MCTTPPLLVAAMSNIHITRIAKIVAGDILKSRILIITFVVVELIIQPQVLMEHGAQLIHVVTNAHTILLLQSAVIIGTVVVGHVIVTLAAKLITLTHLLHQQILLQMIQQ